MPCKERKHVARTGWPRCRIEDARVLALCGGLTDGGDVGLTETQAVALTPAGDATLHAAVECLTTECDALRAAHASDAVALDRPRELVEKKQRSFDNAACRSKPHNEQLKNFEQAFRLKGRHLLEQLHALNVELRRTQELAASMLTHDMRCLSCDWFGRVVRALLPTQDARYIVFVG